MSKNILPGDTAHVVVYGESEQVKVIRVAPKMIQVRYHAIAALTTADIRTDVFTLRANGEWVIKGKQSATVNAAKLVIA